MVGQKDCFGEYKHWENECFICDDNSECENSLNSNGEIRPHGKKSFLKNINQALEYQRENYDYFWKLKIKSFFFMCIVILLVYLFVLFAYLIARIIMN